jgi:sulfoxide reductase heme-binding subunit YedZ
VAAFIYASLHVLEHFLYEGELAGYFKNFWQPFFLAGTFGITVLTVLGATSNNFSVKRLGYRRWKWIHRLVYFAALALVWHVGTVGKGNWPFAKRVFIPLLVLQLLRVIKPLLDRIREKMAPPVTPDKLNPGSSASLS